MASEQDEAYLDDKRRQQARRLVGLLPDYALEALCGPQTDGRTPLIDPFCPGVRGPGLISRGLSSYGYDLTLGDEVWLVTGPDDENDGYDLIDPKAARPLAYKKLVVTTTDSGRWVLVPPLSFVLGHSVERLALPPDVNGSAYGKSTYARSGLLVPVTPIEAGWCGQVTIEVFNSTRRRLKVYVGEGVCQVQFQRGAAPCRHDYGAKGGFYQGQSGVQAALCRPREGS